MFDRVISLWTVAAVSLWCLSLGLVLVGYFTPAGTSDLGLFCSAAAAAATICRSHQITAHQLSDAFELGRDSVKTMHSVR